MPLTNFPDGVDVGTLSIGGSPVTAVEAGGIIGVASGYALARGEDVLDGANPTTVASGLTTIVSVVVALKGTVTPGVGTSVLTAAISGTDINVYAWKPTSASDPTLIASVGTESFYWIAVGT